jgi:transposase-like protein
LALQKIKQRALHKRTRQPIGAKDKHNKAVQAFWATHVEAMDWCGPTTREYAAAHRLSWWSLKTWRKRLASAEFEIDWRAHLHPCARPVISSDASSAAKVQPLENGLTDTASAAPARDGRSNRRNFTLAEKYAIVMEAEQPGVSAAAVCRRHNIATSMIFRWRIQFGVRQQERSELAAVRISDGEGGTTPAAAAELLDLQNISPVPDGMKAVDLADGRRVFAPADSDPEAIRRYVAER